MDAMIIFLVSGSILILMLAMLAMRSKPDYGRDTRANGMSYERFKKVNGSGRL